MTRKRRFPHPHRIALVDCEVLLPEHQPMCGGTVWVHMNKGRVDPKSLKDPDTQPPMKRFVRKTKRNPLRKGLETILLEPICTECAPLRPERTWCRDNAWDDCPEPGCKAGPIAYVEEMTV